MVCFLQLNTRKQTLLKARTEHMANSTIAWTDRTWNPVTGCTEVSPGCDHCYARVMANRLQAMGQAHYTNGFEVTLHEDYLSLPLLWKKPQMVFVNSMSDLFHKDVPDDFIVAVFKTMALANQHTFQVLTKRPSRLVNAGLYKLIERSIGAWPAHVWLGVSVENTDYRWRIASLRRVPAPVRFISAEPLLGPLPSLNLEGISWLIAGSESGHGARPMQDDWVRSLRDQCQAQGVKFFFKQRTVKGHKVQLPELDGKVWDQFPELETTP
jgi:protein gp37